MYVSDASATILRIKQLIKQSLIDIEFMMITNYKKKSFTFQDDPHSYLMKNCDVEAKRVMSEIKQKQGITNISEYGLMAIMVNNMYIDRPVREIIRIVDAQAEEQKFIQLKCPEGYHLVDTNARNVFYKGTSSALLKCVYGFNMYGTRDDIINKDKLNEHCP